MAKILYNKKVSKDFYLLKAEQTNGAKAGQFYMLRAWERYPVLSRPISVYDAGSESVTFLYRVAGQGTEIFSRLNAGDEIVLQGPYGNGFPVHDALGRIALVGGGAGAAPLYLTAKKLCALRSGCRPDIFLGFSEEALLVDEFRSVANRAMIDVGGYITDKVEPEEYDTIFACGPEIMMRALYEKCVRQDAGWKLYVSMERRMACGIGACLVCSCKTNAGGKKVCKDGPVFKASEVFEV